MPSTSTLRVDAPDYVPLGLLRPGQQPAPSATAQQQPAAPPAATAQQRTQTPATAATVWQVGPALQASTARQEEPDALPATSSPRQQQQQQQQQQQLHQEQQQQQQLHQEQQRQQQQERRPARPQDQALTLFEWGHDSPLPVRVTSSRAALRPSIGVCRDWGGTEGGLQLSARAALQLPTRLKLDLTCKEAVLGGRLTASLPACRVEYRKRFKLRNGALLALRAGLEGAGGGSGSGGGGGGAWRQWLRPFFGCQLQVDSGNGSSDDLHVSEQGFSDTHRVVLPARLGGLRLPAMELEVASTLSLPHGLDALASSASLGSLAGLQSLAGSAAAQGLAGSAASLQGLAGSAARGLAGSAASLQGLAGGAAQGLAGSAASLQGLAGGDTAQGLAGGASSLHGLAGIGMPSLPGSAADLHALASGAAQGVSGSGRTGSLQDLAGGLMPPWSSASLPGTPPGLPSLASMRGSLPALPSLPSLSDITAQGSGSSPAHSAGDDVRGQGAAEQQRRQGDRRGLEFHIDRLALLVRL